MVCPACNTEIAADAAFCPKCGQQISATPPAVPTAADKLRATQAASAAHAEPEHELWRGRYSSKAMIRGWITASVITIAALVAGVLVPPPAGLIVAAILIPLAWLIPAIRLLWLRLSYEYTLTTQRFLHKVGVLSQVNDQILLVDVDDITFSQSLLGRMLGFGTITLRAKDMSIQAKDANNDALTLVPVDDVQRVANLIDEARREERRKRAIYMANA